MRKRVFILALSACFCTLNLTAQDVDALRRQAREYEQEIAQINRLISDNNNRQQDAGKNLKLITQKIESRRKIITNLDKQIDLVEKGLGENGTEIVRLNRRLGDMQKQYSAMVKLAYISYRGRSLEMLLGSNSEFQRNLRNVANISKVTEQCTVHAKEIDRTKGDISGKINALEQEQQRIAELLEEKRQETATLEKEKQQIAQLTKELESKNSNLRKQVADNQSKLQSLQKQIQTIIAQESRSNEGKPVNTVLSGEFEQNKGKLPSPVNGGVVVDRFGTHNHPTQSNIKVTNNGINIACSSGASVTAVFNGEVKRMFLVPGMGNSIIVRHGKYLTVYANLDAVSVKVGDTVKTGQKLGTISGEDGMLHFEIWNETTMQDPQKWISI